MSPTSSPFLKISSDAKVIAWWDELHEHAVAQAKQPPNTTIIGRLREMDHLNWFEAHCRNAPERCLPSRTESSSNGKRSREQYAEDDVSSDQRSPPSKANDHDNGGRAKKQRLDGAGAAIDKTLPASSASRVESFLARHGSRMEAYIARHGQDQWIIALVKRHYFIMTQKLVDREKARLEYLRAVSMGTLLSPDSGDAIDMLKKKWGSKLNEEQKAKCIAKLREEDWGTIWMRGDYHLRSYWVREWTEPEGSPWRRRRDAQCRKNMRDWEREQEASQAK